MIKQVLAVIAGLAFATPVPVFATGWKDVNLLKELVSGTGTKVLLQNCTEGGVYGYYEYNPSADVDTLVICSNTTDHKDPDAVWETLAHEATHAMQACAGGPIVEDVIVPRMLRELQELTPHYYRILMSYASSEKRTELEAFWMELRHPEYVINTFIKLCYTKDK